MRGDVVRAYDQWNVPLRGLREKPDEYLTINDVSEFHSQQAG